MRVFCFLTHLSFIINSTCLVGHLFLPLFIESSTWSLIILSIVIIRRENKMQNGRGQFGQWNFGVCPCDSLLFCVVHVPAGEPFASCRNPVPPQGPTLTIRLGLSPCRRRLHVLDTMQLRESARSEWSSVTVTWQTVDASRDWFLL